MLFKYLAKKVGIAIRDV